MTTPSPQGVPNESDEVWQVKYEDLVMYEEIGSGQFGKVFKADYFGATVGVKKINNDPGQDKLMLKFIQREIEILKYNHPNIVNLIGVAAHENDLFLVTEYCEAGDLCKYLRDPDVKIPWGIRARMASDISSAMAFLHAKNITHRDLKSQNCLVTENWRVKLCDFGFARKVVATSQPAFMTLCGTDDFMSPEIILGEDYDERSDIFSFGLLLCEIIIRKRICDVLPRTPATYFGVEEKMFWSQIPKDCPPKLSQLAWNCVAYYPQDRPSFKEIMTRVRALERELTPSSPIQSPILEAPHLHQKKKNVQTERKLVKSESVPITVEASVLHEGGGDYGPEPSPRRKKDKQAVLKQLVDEFFKRNKQDKEEKKQKEEEKRHMKEEKKEEKRLREEEKREEKRLREEEKKAAAAEKAEKAAAAEANGEMKSPRKSKLWFSSEMQPPDDFKLDPEEHDEHSRKRSHRLSLNLGNLVGDKRKDRRSTAVKLGPELVDTAVANH